MNKHAINLIKYSRNLAELKIAKKDIHWREERKYEEEKKKQNPENVTRINISLFTLQQILLSNS